MNLFSNCAKGFRGSIIIKWIKVKKLDRATWNWSLYIYIYIGKIIQILFSWSIRKKVQISIGKWSGLKNNWDFFFFFNKKTYLVICHKINWFSNKPYQNKERKTNLSTTTTTTTKKKKKKKRRRRRRRKTKSKGWHKTKSLAAN